MPLPLAPPIAPMLARLARELPEGDWIYEPKWDGFRCLAFAAGPEAGPAGVDLRSRHHRPLARYFPEVVEALAALPRPARGARAARDAARGPPLGARLQPRARPDRPARHPARFVRWRPDREPRSCTLDQLRGFG